MSTSRKLLFSLIFMACSAAAASDVEVYAYVGGDAVVPCSYPAGYKSYVKYFCSEACGNADVKKSDAGKYWCGVSKSGTDIYTAVTLAVKSDECCDNVQSIQAYERSSVSIRCPHQNQYANSFKYVCKGSQPSTCRTQALVTTKKAQNGQFRLRDDEFTLELNHITKQNAGLYMCGIERSNDFDVFSRVNLTVKDWCCATTHDVKGFLGQSVTLNCPYPSKHGHNTKFLCKTDQEKCPKVVSSTTTADRFTLMEDRSSNSFKVTIQRLKPTDAGTYWCGSDSQWAPGNNYVRLQLTLETLRATTGSYFKTTSDMPTSGSQSLLKDADNVISPVVLYVLPGSLLIVVVMIAVIMYKCLRTQRNRVDYNVRCNKEEVSTNEVYCNQEPTDENIYENNSNEHIYGNC
uniref:Immunoglobulin domain-containing protein n=1 Tax=Knipowitschia caucasica TaxID=637954 RepID=A0AAV2LNL7_KNICA